MEVGVSSIFWAKKTSTGTPNASAIIGSLSALIFRSLLSYFESVDGAIFKIFARYLAVTPFSCRTRLMAEPTLRY